VANSVWPSWRTGQPAPHVRSDRVARRAHRLQQSGNRQRMVAWCGRRTGTGHSWHPASHQPALRPSRSGVR